jgi:aspartyl/asparaginyl-tRNA synthetase
VSSLTPALAGSTVLIRARLFVMRETGKVLFITLRQGVSTAQAVVLKSDDKDLFKWATSAYSARC